MKIMHLIFFSLFSIFGWILSERGSLYSSAEVDTVREIFFQEEGFDDFQDVADDVNFPQILFFTAPWCNTCHLMEAHVLSDSTVSAFSNENYMSYKVNVQSFEGYDIKNKYKVQVFPTILILDSKGKRLEKITGYCDSNRLIDKLQKY